MRNPYVIEGHSVTVPARIARMLVQNGVVRGLRQRFANDLELEMVLQGCERIAQFPANTARGTEFAELAELPAPLLLSTQQVAARLRITPRGVRAAIARGDLGAELVNGRWVVTPDQVARFAKSRP
ncbi:helix-turn-helix domain-containing protein [Cryobacterium glucosi]|uniref:helix-turn-helix domain-containing protein n=1 Tax=Cryobacterium glucosi TaxID=1259175 RepID=UPI003B9706A8